MDCLLTSVIDETQVKVVAWYDNEWGYSTRLVELPERVMGPSTSWSLRRGPAAVPEIAALVLDEARR